jgi:hypothetical protein
MSKTLITTEGKPKANMGRLPWMQMLLGVISGQCGSAEGFTAFDCSNRSNIVELYSLLEPDACMASDGNGEIKTAVYGEIIQMKQDRIHTHV